jgi:5-oxoprolinase (ATP-hydrolysing) subunit A
MNRIDVNCDMGELPEAAADGTQESLMEHVTSVNIACGGHAGDEVLMETTVRMALARDRQIGAHPGYPDRENFGRLDLVMSAEELANSVYEQIRTLEGVTRRAGAEIRHVKPHGALYNTAVRNTTTARAIAEGVARWSRDVTLVGKAGSLMLEVFQEAGFRVAAEAFADRRYEQDGSLRGRRLPGALIEDPSTAAEQALRLAASGVDTICLHGDTPGAVRVAAALAERLRRAGIALLPMGTR